MANPNTPVFPLAIPTDLDLLVAGDDAYTTLSAGINASQTTFDLDNADNFVQPAMILIESELILIKTLSGNSVTDCTRGFLGTAASSHADETPVYGYVFGYYHNQLAAEIKAICTKLGVNGDNYINTGTAASGDLTGFFPDPSLSVVNSNTGVWGSGSGIPSITLDSKGRATAAEEIAPDVAIDFPAAIAQGGSAVLKLTYAAADGPTGVVIAGSNVLQAAARFADVTLNVVQGSFVAPDSWGGNLDVDIFWKSTSITGTCTWKIEMAGAIVDGSLDPVWNTASQTNAAPSGVASKLNKTTLSGVTITGMAEGVPGFFKLSRLASDTLGAAADLLSVRFRFNTP